MLPFGYVSEIIKSHKSFVYSQPTSRPDFSALLATYAIYIIEYIMVTENISLIVAFIGGLLSFLSPCVLPLVPVYLASLYGPEIFDSGGSRIRIPLFFHSLSFVVGFSIVFVALGAIVGLTGYAVNPSYALLSRVAGSLLVVFGLFMLVALKVPWLNY